MLPFGYHVAKCPVRETFGGSVNITQAAESCGLPVKTIRYYEELGLVVPSRNSRNGYRVYSPENIAHLHFLKLCRASGVGLEKSAQLLRVYALGRLDADEFTLVGECIDALAQQINSLRRLSDLLVGLLPAESLEGAAQGSVSAPILPFRLI